MYPRYIERALKASSSIDQQEESCMLVISVRPVGQVVPSSLIGSARFTHIDNAILVQSPSPPQLLPSMSQYTLIVLQKLQVQHKAASILIAICITVTYIMVK